MLTFLPLCAAAQSVFPAQQSEIARNNPTLHALAVQAEAVQADNMTGLNLPNPELSVSYMFGAPADVPNKTNIGVSQSFDFATLSGAKRRAAKAANQAESASLLTERQTVALEVENALIEYAYQYQLCQELEEQYQALLELQKYTKLALEKGTLTILDANKADLEVLAKSNDLALARVDLEASARELRRLNGGLALTSLPQTWPDAPLPDSFATWVEQASAQSAELTTLRAEVDAAAQQVNLRQKEGLPDFSLGYVNELVKDANYHGAEIGLSLPLWGNHNRVKTARALQTAAALRLDDATEQFQNRKMAEWQRARALRQAADLYGEVYTRTRTQAEEYMEKALKAGKISVLEYITEHDDFFTHATKTLEVQRDYQLARAALYAPTLLPK